MPKLVERSLPLNGLFAINKPSGITCMAMINSLKPLINDSPLFVQAGDLEKQRSSAKPTKARGRKAQKSGGGVKIGQGGTLDPLADGVLVIGVNKGTKQLSNLLSCSKEYQTTGLLGCETDTYDSEGAIVREAPWRHITRSTIENVLGMFTGKIKQTPPIYSALKMDGKPLYEYAREGIPLPKPIEARDAEIFNLELVDFQEAAPSPPSRSPSSSSSSETANVSPGHMYRFPSQEMDDAGKQAMNNIKNLISEAESKRSLTDEKPITAKLLASPELSPLHPQHPPPDETNQQVDPTPDTRVRPPTFTLKLTVSSGTYVRSIVHDIGLAVGSAAHVVALRRTRQGDFALGEADGEDPDGDCIPWKQFVDAIERHDAAGGGSPVDAATDTARLADWEKDVMNKFQG